jgi:hypothetical protein
MFAIDRLGISTRLTGLVLVTLLFAGCSDSDDTSSPPSAAANAASSPAPTVSPTVAPESIAVHGTPPASVVAGSRYSFEPTVSRSATLVTFAITGQPTWAQFDSSTGALSGTPAVNDEGTTGHITITASNGAASASTTPFTIRISPPSVGTHSAALSWVAPTENTDGTPVTDLAGYHIYYGTNAGELTSSIDVAGGGSTNYTVNGLAEGTYYFAVIAYNSAGFDSGKSNIADQAI